MNNCFHADFSQWTRRLVHERETERLSRGQTKGCLNRGPLVWPEKPFDPGGVWGVFSWRFPIKKFVPLSSFFPTPSALSIPGKAVKAKSVREGETTKAAIPLPPPTTPLRERSFLCEDLGLTLTHWLFYLMWNSTRSAEPRQLLPQQKNKTHLPPLFLSPCLSFACRHKQPELHWFSFTFLYWICFLNLFYWIRYWGSKTGIIQVMAFYPYSNQNDFKGKRSRYVLFWVTKTVKLSSCAFTLKKSKNWTCLRPSVTHNWLVKQWATCKNEAFLI